MADKRLLIVEDDEGLRRQMRWGFEDFTVDVAGDQASAIELVKKHRPPVVTLDLGLPPDPDGATEGLATLSAILSEAPGTKVIPVLRERWIPHERHGNGCPARFQIGWSPPASGVRVIVHTPSLVP